MYVSTGIKLPVILYIVILSYNSGSMFYMLDVSSLSVNLGHSWVSSEAEFGFAVEVDFYIQ